MVSPVLAVALTLIGSSVFLATFYLALFSQRSEEDSLPELNHEPDLTIFMPAYNEEDVVEQALDSVKSLNYSNYSVKFVDDGSTDETLSIARRMADETVEVIEHEENQGKAAAINTALENTETKYCVVIDADSRIQDGLLRKAVRRMESDDSYGAVISSIMPLSTNTLVRRLQVVEYRVRDFYRHLMADVDILDVTPGAFSLYRTEEVRRAGGFDEGNLTEDLEMAWSLRKNGCKLGMVSEMRSFTELPGGLRGLHGQRVRWARGHIQNLVKHRDMLFNSDYGWFGLFQMPIAIVLPFFAIIGFGMFITGILESVYNSIIVLTTVGVRMPTFGDLNLVRTVLGLNVKVYLPLLISLVAMAKVIRESYRMFDEEMEHPFALAIYFLGYFAIKPVFWISAILKEIAGVKNTWT